MRTITTVSVFAVVAMFATVSLDTAAEARKVHAPRGAKNVSKSIGKTVRNAGRSVGNAARWTGNALWVGTGVGWGHAKVTNNCNYYYKQYKQTGNPKWKNQYNACIR